MAISARAPRCLNTCSAPPAPSPLFVACSTSHRHLSTFHAVFVASYLFFAGAGPAFPDSFKHDDGGTYRGQWRGMRKEGLGVYT